MKDIFFLFIFFLNCYFLLDFFLLDITIIMAMTSESKMCNEKIGRQ